MRKRAVLTLFGQRGRRLHLSLAALEPRRSKFVPEHMHDCLLQEFARGDVKVGLRGEMLLNLFGEVLCGCQLIYVGRNSLALEQEFSVHAPAFALCRVRLLPFASITRQ
jgi:hypothetical protein